MAEPNTPQDDPIVSRSYALYYLISIVVLIASLFWALWDEAYGQRPWKAYQHEFSQRYVAFLKTAQGQSADAEKQIESTQDYQQLKAAVDAETAKIAPQVKQMREQIADADMRLGVIQKTFTDARAHVTADTYDLETTSSNSSRDRKLKELDDYENKKQFEVDLPEYKNQKFSFHELEDIYNAAKQKKADLVAQLATLSKPQKDAQAKLDAYVSDRMTSLTPDQLEGLQTKYANWEPQIVQINVAKAAFVDRCQSCHMGILEPVKLTPASMSVGKNEDEYARAFVSHPNEDLLKIHDPEKFGCASCHGGNGRATTSVEKAHGNYEHWLAPLYAKDNMEAGCQTCHAADMVLGNVGTPEMGKIIDEGKDLFRQRGCNGCHRYEGYDKEPEELVSIQQQIKQIETQKKDNLKLAAEVTSEGDKAETNEEANKFYAKAEALKVDNSVLDGQITQLDYRSRDVLRDMKKIGPDLKEVREKLNKNWIPVWLHKPTDFRATTKMPNFRLTDDQIKAIAAYLWQTALTDPLPQAKPGNAAHGKELFETRGCLACHSIGEGDQMMGGTFAANLTRVGEKANYNYLVRWVHNPRQRTRPYCPYEKKDIGPEDYAKHNLPYVFDFEHSKCPNDGHELQVEQMTVMPVLRLSQADAEDVASYLITLKKKDPKDNPDASFMDDPKLKETGAFWIRHYGCAGCHEIAGFEDEGRIGTELTQEGSKPIDRMDFALLTQASEDGDGEPKKWYDEADIQRLPNGPAKPGQPWHTIKGFFEHKLSEPNIFDYDMEGRPMVKGPTEKLRMPNPHLSQEQIRALVTFLLGSQDMSGMDPEYLYKPGDRRHDIQAGWWVIKKYNCMGCHQFMPGQMTTLMQLPRYQDPDWKEQLPPKLLTEGARVNPDWMLKFLRNPALDDKDTNKNGVRPYLKVRMPTFEFSDNELRILVRFFQASAEQPMPYLPQPVEPLTPKEQDMARALFSSTAAPCLKCHATGDPLHDRTATAPNFLLAKDRLKPSWMEQWVVDPQAISPGTSMPSNLFKKTDTGQWVFSGPTPAIFNGYDKNHNELLVRYIMQLTPEEQRRVSAMMGRGGTKTTSLRPAKKSENTTGAGGR
jgi:cbb3-type cytochrome oxidase cytochrome c subunit